MKDTMPKELRGVAPPPRAKGAPAPTRKRQNAVQKQERKAAALQLLLKQVGRKAQRGVEPNDRHYNEKVAKSLRRLRPHELDRLVRHGEDD